MTDKTPARPELPEPELGYIRTDKSRQPAFSAAQMRAALQSAQPAAAVSDAEIDAAVLHATGFDGIGLQDMNRFDCRDIARAILALRPQAVHPDTARCIKARNDLNAALHGEGALIDDLEHAVANACAKMLRPQAVPMTDEQFTQLLRKLKRSREVFQAGRDSYETACAPMNSDDEAWFAYLAHHGITQRADGGEAA
jgi:hypothetical protein